MSQPSLLSTFLVPDQIIMESKPYLGVVTIQCTEKILYPEIQNFKLVDLS